MWDEHGNTKTDRYQTFSRLSCYQPAISVGLLSILSKSPTDKQVFSDKCFITSVLPNVFCLSRFRVRRTNWLCRSARLKGRLSSGVRAVAKEREVKGVSGGTTKRVTTSRSFSVKAAPTTGRAKKLSCEVIFIA